MLTINYCNKQLNNGSPQNGEGCREFLV